VLMTSGRAVTDEQGMGAPSRARVLVLDRGKWAREAFYLDTLALAVLLFGALGLGLDLYTAGFNRALAAPAAGSADFGLLVRLGVGLVAVAGAFAWLAARVLRAGYRDLPGSG
jgi:hypothetical protein